MSENDKPTSDYLIGHDLAASAMIVELMRALVEKGIFSQQEMRAVLNSALRSFTHPQGTDAESCAAGTIISVYSKIFESYP